MIREANTGQKRGIYQVSNQRNNINQSINEIMNQLMNETMKPSFLIATFMCIFAVSSLSAQNFEGKLIGGLTTSQINGDGVAGYNKFGFTFGAATNFYMPSNERLSFQQELAFHMRGSHSSPKEVFAWSLRMNYLDVSLLANYYLTEDMFVQFGPTVGALMSARAAGFGTTELTEAKPFDVAANLGMGYMLNENLEANVRVLYSVLSSSTLRWPFHHNSIAATLRYHL